MFFFKLKKINKENYRTNVRVTEPQKVSYIEASQKSCQHCNAHLTVKMQPGLSQESLFWRHVPRIDFWVPLWLGRINVIELPVVNVSGISFTWSLLSRPNYSLAISRIIISRYI